MVLYIKCAVFVECMKLSDFMQNLISCQREHGIRKRNPTHENNVQERGIILKIGEMSKVIIKFS